MDSEKFLLPIMVDNVTFYLELDGSMRMDAIKSKTESLMKLKKELDKIKKQIVSFTENTPWKIAHEKRMNYYDKLDEYLNNLDFLKRLGMHTG